MPNNVIESTNTPEDAPRIDISSMSRVGEFLNQLETSPEFAREYVDTLRDYLEEDKPRDLDVKTNEIIDAVETYLLDVEHPSENADPDSSPNLLRLLGMLAPSILPFAIMAGVKLMANRAEQTEGVKQTEDKQIEWRFFASNAEHSLFISKSSHKNPTRIQLVLEDDNGSSVGFTPEYISEVILPYVSAMIQIQNVLDTVAGRPKANIKILGINQGSVNIDLTGGIRDTAELVLNEVIPQRRRTQRERAKLSLKEKELELKQKAVEVQQTRATMNQGKAQAKAELEKLEAEKQLIEMQVQEQTLNNQKTRLENMSLAMDMLKHVAPNLSDEQRLLYAMQLISPIEQIAASPLALVSWKEIGGPADEVENGEESSTSENQSPTPDQES